MNFKHLVILLIVNCGTNVSAALGCEYTFSAKTSVNTESLTSKGVEKATSEETIKEVRELFVLTDSKPFSFFGVLSVYSFEDKRLLKSDYLNRVTNDCTTNATIYYNNIKKEKSYLPRQLDDPSACHYWVYSS